ncbi:uncharacterized protein LOC116159424 [Photinus pyralis]|uniref:uncharacterized protein LOC116159424 n=1 Tax=Photinus pyralis TaxID=7054 RepID=UPI0012670647|nr:uncharacterized protein LOC116159424 [Photinus pyralis]
MNWMHSHGTVGNLLQVLHLLKIHKSAVINLLLYATEDHTDSAADVEAAVHDNPTEGYTEPTSPQSGYDTDDLCRWSFEGVTLLLNLYGEKQDVLVKGKVKQKAFWNSIAELMAKHGYTYTASQCKTKLATLKRQYKKVKDHNKVSGNDRKDWPYLEAMDEIFSSQPWLVPVSLASSSSASVNSAASSSSTSTSITPSTSATCAIANKNSPKTEGKKKQSPKKNRKLVDILNKLREDKEKHHKERMEKSTEALSLLRTLVDNISKK